MQVLFRNIDRNVNRGRVHVLEQHAGLHARAAAKLDQARLLADHAGHLVDVACHDFELGIRQVILG